MRRTNTSGWQYQHMSFGDLLFDLQEDPHQNSLCQDEAVKEKMCAALIQQMHYSEAPAEQFRRLGLV